ncbi:hypothetical protein HW555_003790 [Spodoptera exigua]|uniref:Uncharacterized protein n=1 Tax=Spodoptera exigua TaxID=7107 RepID=A0A835GJI6_SPOEX|nr:hypothetical protein HW555_003790 [Spodoptera exigua]
MTEICCPCSSRTTCKADTSVGGEHMQRIAYITPIAYKYQRIYVTSNFGNSYAYHFVTHSVNGHLLAGISYDNEEILVLPLVTFLIPPCTAMLCCASAVLPFIVIHVTQPELSSKITETILVVIPAFVEVLGTIETVLEHLNIVKKNI